MTDQQKKRKYAKCMGRQSGDTMEWLESENARLKKLVERDGLTGLLNRTAAEKRVNHVLRTMCKGGMLLLDMDHFKLINDQYGHLAGDAALREVGYVLDKMLTGKLIARIGGDEFLVFFPEEVSEDVTFQWGEQVKARLAQIKVPDSDVYLSVSTGSTCYQNGDFYQTMFSRADQMLLQHKRQRGNERQRFSRFGTISEFEMDIELIAKKLREPPVCPGAFYQNYDAFLVIFRFLERSLYRAQKGEKNQDITVVLFTITNQPKDLNVVLEQREQQMKVLGEEIQNNLRFSDVFIQYSSCQYLVLLLGAGEEAAQQVAERICHNFYINIPGSASNVIVHHNFPLRPVQRGETSKRG